MPFVVGLLWVLVISVRLAGAPRGAAGTRRSGLRPGLPAAAVVATLADPDARFPRGPGPGVHHVRDTAGPASTARWTLAAAGLLALRAHPAEMDRWPASRRRHGPRQHLPERRVRRAAAAARSARLSGCPATPIGRLFLGCGLASTLDPGGLHLRRVRTGHAPRCAPARPRGGLGLVVDVDARVRAARHAGRAALPRRAPARPALAAAPPPGAADRRAHGRGEHVPPGQLQNHPARPNPLGAPPAHWVFAALGGVTARVAARRHGRAAAAAVLRWRRAPGSSGPSSAGSPSLRCCGRGGGAPVPHPLGPP